MNTDKIMQAVCTGLLVTGVMMIAASSQAATVSTSPDGSSATITIPVTITNILPTCDLKLNGQNTSLNYELGKMAPGTTMVHPAFTVSIECQGDIPVKTAIKAALLSGGKVQSGNEDIRLDVGGISAGNNTPLLQLQTEAGGKVKFSGDDKDAFCEKADTTQAQPNVCALRPVTDIPAQSPEGEFEASVQLTVVYPQ